MREHERRRAEQRKADRERLLAAATELRHRGQQDAYAGLRGEYVADALAAVLDGLALGMPDQAHREAMRAARMLLDGPDGKRDERAGSMPPLSAGPGH